MKKIKIKPVLICLGIFIFFVVIRFPLQNLRGYVFSQIYKRSSIMVASEGMSLNLLGWPGIEMKNVDLTAPALLLGTALSISAKNAVVRVGLASLFPPSLSYSINISGLKKGGDLYAIISNLNVSGQELTRVSVSFSANNVVLNPEPLDSGWIMGKLSAQGSVFYDSTDLTKIQGEFNLNAQSMKTMGQNIQGIIIPPINWGVIKTNLSIKKGAVDIKQFSIGSNDSDVQGSITGDIILGRELMGSHLNLSSIKLTFSDEFLKNPNSDTIISTLNSIDKRRPGNYSMRWNKSFEEIAQNVLFALPERN